MKIECRWTKKLLKDRRNIKICDISRVYKNIFRLDKIISEMCVANIPIKFIQIDTNYKNCTIILRIYIYQLPKIIYRTFSRNNYHEIDFN